MNPIAQEVIIKEIKAQWQALWQERIDDKVRAEAIANKNYETLFVDKGTVVYATRNFKQLNLIDILEQHKLVNTGRIMPPDPNIGGWRKFTRTMITSQKASRTHRRTRLYQEDKKQTQQLKKRGRGWLHF
jgi:hypothetical protein